MKNTQALSDKLAIGLSLMCVIHCLALPFALVLIPSMAALSLDNEAFHLWMVIAVIPTSVYALTLGCKTHKRYRLLALGGFGLLLLVTALILGVESIGEMGEKSLTLLGAIFVALGHWLNYQHCQSASRPPCECD